MRRFARAAARLVAPCGSRGAHCGGEQQARTLLPPRFALTRRCVPVQDVVLALGGNQGDRAALLSAALRALPLLGVTPTACSSLYESAAAYVTDQARPRAAAARPLSTSPTPAPSRPF